MISATPSSTVPAEVAPTIASTMQDDFPLTVPMILRHAEALHGEARVALAEDGRVRHLTVAEVAVRVHRLTGALQAWGVRTGECVGTFAWNTQAHLEAYFAVPATGAVLHTINLRLFPEQIAFIVREAADRLLLVDASMLDVIVGVLPECPSVELLVVCGDVGPVDLGALPVAATTYEDFLATSEPCAEDEDQERNLE